MTTVEELDGITDEVVASVGRLVGQLSSTSPPPDRAQLEAIVASPATTLIVARQEGEVVGMLTLAIFPIPTGVRAWIEDVVVDQAARGRGIGEALTRRAVEVAAAGGARSVDLTSRPSRESANRLYRRLGFEPRETNVYRYQAPPG